MMNIVIVGAGPSGLYLAHRLLALGSNYRIQLYDCNADPMNLASFDSRGFGLGLGARVQHWLSSIEGLEEQLTSTGIKFASRGLVLIPRRQLCALLLRSLLAKYSHPMAPAESRLAVNFNTSVVAVDLTRHEITVNQASESKTVAYDLLIGADGVHSMIRSAMMAAKPDEIRFKEQQRPQVWKVLQVSLEPEQEQPTIIRLQTRRAPSGLIFGACLPQKEGQFSALIFWQPSGDRDQMNPCGLTTPEELQQLLQEMAPHHLSALKLDSSQAQAFLTASPGHEYWSQCQRYHDLEGRAVLIGDAAHGMYSLLGQGCTAAIADAVALSALLQQHSEQWSIVLPQFSMQQVKEGQAASDLSLLALLFYHRWFGPFYKIATLLWVFILRQPSIFAQINQVDSTYMQVLHKNRLWIWLAKSIGSVET